MPPTPASRTSRGQLHAAREQAAAGRVSGVSGNLLCEPRPPVTKLRSVLTGPPAARCPLVRLRVLSVQTSLQGWPALLSAPRLAVRDLSPRRSARVRLRDWRPCLWAHTAFEWVLSPEVRPRIHLQTLVLSKHATLSVGRELAAPACPATRCHPAGHSLAPCVDGTSGSVSSSLIPLDARPPLPAARHPLLSPLFPSDRPSGSLLTRRPLVNPSGVAQRPQRPSWTLVWPPMGTGTVTLATRGFHGDPRGLCSHVISPCRRTHTHGTQTRVCRPLGAPGFRISSCPITSHTRPCLEGAGREQHRREREHHSPWGSSPPPR